MPGVLLEVKCTPSFIDLMNGKSCWPALFWSRARSGVSLFPFYASVYILLMLMRWVSCCHYENMLACAFLFLSCLPESFVMEKDPIFFVHCDGGIKERLRLKANERKPFFLGVAFPVPLSLSLLFMHFSLISQSCHSSPSNKPLM